MQAEELIKHFDLQPHPEGGFFKESYRASGKTKTASGERSFSTGIYFLIPAGKKSSLHRLASDEGWHFYLGDPLKLFQISSDDKFSETILGHDVSVGQKLQHFVPAGDWFGAMPLSGSNGFSFVGCTVAPGFDFADFEMGNRSELLAMYPHARPIIERLMN